MLLALSPALVPPPMTYQPLPSTTAEPSPWREVGQRLDRAPDRIEHRIVDLVLGKSAIGIERLATKDVDAPVECARGQLRRAG